MINEKAPVPEPEILFQSQRNDFRIIDAGINNLTVQITTANGRLTPGHATSDGMNSLETALFMATKIPLHELRKMQPEQVKDVLRKRNPKIQK